MINHFYLSPCYSLSLSLFIFLSLSLSLYLSLSLSIYIYMYILFSCIDYQLENNRLNLNYAERCLGFFPSNRYAVILQVIQIDVIELTIL